MMNMRKGVLRLLLLPVLAMLCARGAAQAQERIVIGNDLVRRELAFDGHVWRTVSFVRGDGSDSLAAESDEFHVLLMDGGAVTIGDYQIDGDVRRERSGGNERVTLEYVPRNGLAVPAGAPKRVAIEYWAGGEPYVRKQIYLQLEAGGAIDRLEVERFAVKEQASRGGRGEPVFVGPWLFGVEYPAFYSRHTDGNTPVAASGPYDKLGNYGFIDLEGHDVENQPRAGLVRLMHFPGMAKKLSDEAWGIAGKTAVAGIGKPGDSNEIAFLDYLSTIRRPVRSFIHYNNWYDRDGKDLSVENFVNRTFIPFKRNLDPYGVKIHAMVPDDGWQEKKSIYEPNPQRFPNGMADMRALGAALREAGTQMGLWIALNGYNSDIDWGKANGYLEAERNQHFTKFKRYYSITHPQYNAKIKERLSVLMKECGIQYLKHDFNEMCDIGEGRGHLATDRHGHEASVDAELELLALEREINPEIYQNITNWIWFSPWWLAHGNNVWMLANDTGEYRDWPEISTLKMAAAYRDVHLHRAWGDPATRPLVPISHLMTHGIIYTKTKYAGGKDTLRDFSDYVMMYYMRGLQLKEWYINPSIMTPEQWEVLGRATRWSEEHVTTLANAVLIGGNPAKREPYGYACWEGEKGIVSVRNAGPDAAEIEVPFDQSVWYRGEAGQPFRAKVVYPYQRDWPAGFKSGEALRIKIPGDTLMVLELEPGAPVGTKEPAPSPVTLEREDAEGQWVAKLAIPDEAMQRCELLVTGRDAFVEVKVEGEISSPTRTSEGKNWKLAAHDLRDFRGKTLTIAARHGNKPAGIEGWLILDRPVAGMKDDDGDARNPKPIAQGHRRVSVKVFGK